MRLWKYLLGLVLVGISLLLSGCIEPEPPVVTTTITTIPDITTTSTPIPTTTLTRTTTTTTTTTTTIPKIKIAFLCYGSSCSYQYERDWIEWLNSKGFTVTGKAYTTFTLAELKQHDVIFCHSRQSCGLTENIKQAHREGVGFIEMGYTGWAFAGLNFGYTTRIMTSTADQDGIVITDTSHYITEGQRLNAETMFTATHWTDQRINKYFMVGKELAAATTGKHGPTLWVVNDKYVWFGYMTKLSPHEIKQPYFVPYTIPRQEVNPPKIIVRAIEWVA